MFNKGNNLQKSVRTWSWLLLVVAMFYWVPPWISFVLAIMVETEVTQWQGLLYCIYLVAFILAASYVIVDDKTVTAAEMARSLLLLAFHDRVQGFGLNF